MTTLKVNVFTNPTQLAAFVNGLKPDQRVAGASAGSTGAIELSPGGAELASKKKKLESIITTRVAFDVILQKMARLPESRFSEAEEALRNVYTELNKPDAAKARDLKGPLNTLAKIYEANMPGTAESAVEAFGSEVEIKYLRNRDASGEQSNDLFQWHNLTQAQFKTIEELLDRLVSISRPPSHN